MYTKSQLRFLRENYKTMRGEDLTTAFNAKFNLNKTYTQIRSTLKNHNIQCGRKGGYSKGERLMFNQEQLAWLAKNYKKLTVQDLTKAFNARYNLDKTPGQMKGHLTRNRIRSGRTGCFKAGHKPWCAGTTGLLKANSGTFKKGIVPANTKPLGHERIDTQDGYILIKVEEPDPYSNAPTRYKHKQVFIWEQHHGPVPADHLITFIDDDRMNCNIENLECISHAEHIRRNYLQINSYPGSVRPVLKNIAKLANVIHQKQQQ